MSDHNIEIPTKFFGYGSTYGPQHDTLIAQARNAFETRTGNWRHPRRQFNVVQELMGEDDLRDLQEFVIAREGSLNSFRVKDLIDFTTATDHVSDPAWDDFRIGTGDGTTTDFRLVKRYQSEDGAANGRYETTRRLQKTVTVVSGLDSTEKTEGVDFTVDNTTGTVSYMSAPAAGSGVFAGCEFRVKARFKLDLDEWLQNALSDFEAGSLSAPMIEDKIATSQDVDRVPTEAGFAHTATTGVVQIEFQHGYLHFVVPAAAMTVRLPAILLNSGEIGYENAVAPGGPYFSVFNLNATHNITLQQLNASGVWENLANPTILPGRLRKFWISTSSLWRAW